jgi:hypothetical protein
MDAERELVIDAFCKLARGNYVAEPEQLIAEAERVVSIRSRTKTRVLALVASFLLLIFTSFPSVAQKSAALTVAQSLSMLQAMRVLDGRTVVVKQNGGETAVVQPWDFGSGALRLRIAKNTTALAEIEKALEDTRQAIVREILKSMPPAKDGTAPTEIPPGTPQWSELQKQFGDALNAPAQVTLSRIRASELKLDRNEIPGTALSAMAPILDDDVSPK